MKPALRSAALLIVVLAPWNSPLPGQKLFDAPQSIRFSTVSVRPSTADSRSDLTLTDNGLVERGNTLLWLIELAYSLPSDRYVSGVPGWTRAEKYDITAKVEDKDAAAYQSMKPDQKATLLRSVLKERFQLRSHTETRLFSQYAL